MEGRALQFLETTPIHRFRNVEDTWVTIQELEAFTSPVNIMDQLHQGEVKENRLTFPDRAVIIAEDRWFHGEVYRKCPHMDQFLLLDSNHPLQHKLTVIRTLHPRTQEVPSSDEERMKVQVHKAFRTCPNGDFLQIPKIKKTGNKRIWTKKDQIQSFVVFPVCQTNVNLIFL